MPMYCVVEWTKEIEPRFVRVHGPYLSLARANEAAGKAGWSGDQGLSSLHLTVHEMVPDPHAPRIKAVSP